MKSDEALLKAAKLHYATDIWIETPAFLTVLITGLIMLEAEHLQGLFLAKIIFASLAILCNIICVYAVAKRRKFALNNDIAGMKSTGRLMQFGGLLIPTFLIAFVISAYLVIHH